ncbi:LysR family transcriptional regulator [Klebsiella pneumoniae]|uniref:LysR family transcriptional regulator n=1 Tax=Klebsiella pneumoniae TaxID=573 RepID=A0A2X3CZW4_KLEPN|nr:LysR family transcriptional regulator [Klebsiella pneumoniae]
MDKLDTLTLFVRIVERGSFSAPPRIWGFPGQYRPRLLKRWRSVSGRGCYIVPPGTYGRRQKGSLYYQRCVSILAALEEANRSAGGGASPAPFG